MTQGKAHILRKLLHHQWQVEDTQGVLFDWGLTLQLAMNRARQESEFCDCVVMVRKEGTALPVAMFHSGVEYRPLADD